MTVSAAKILGWLAIFGIFAIAAATADAQGRYRGRNFSKVDVNRIIQRVETRSDEFTATVDRFLDRSRLDGTRKEDRINEQVRELEQAIDGLRADFDRSDEWRETRRQVQAVLNQSDEINRIVRNNRFSPRIVSGWNLLRGDLNRLAGIYDLRLLR
jgi:hypothetical protein